MAVASVPGKKTQIQAKFPYLARSPLYAKQKPFATDFTPREVPVSTPLTNHRFDFQELAVTDAQDARSAFTLGRNGFCFLTCPTAVRYEDYGDVGVLENIYYAEIEAVLHAAFPEYSRLECLDHQIRKRAAAFPEQPGRQVPAAQPAVLPHTDFSSGGTSFAMHHFFPGQERYWQDQDFDLLNIWRVLKGPNNDWPLALCDFQSVDPADAVLNDVLHEDSVGENELLYKDGGHKWYYLQDQQVDDLIVFRNNDRWERRARAFHAAFDTGVEGAHKRESIEVRCVAFR